MSNPDPLQQQSASDNTPLTQQATVMRRLYQGDVWQGYTPGARLEQQVEGWNGTHPVFKQLLETAPNQIFVDVGVWKGSSTIFVANLMRQGGMDGCVIAVDTFLGSFEHNIGGRKWFERHHGRPDLYERFLQNVFHAGLTHLVVPLPQTSLTAATLLQHTKIAPGIVHLDAAHDYRSVLHDIEAYWPLIARGGHLVGDDYDPTWPGVVRAADEFSARVGIKLSSAPPKFILSKPL